MTLLIVIVLVLNVALVLKVRCLGCNDIMAFGVLPKIIKGIYLFFQGFFNHSLDGITSSSKINLRTLGARYVSLWFHCVSSLYYPSNNIHVKNLAQRNS